MKFEKPYYELKYPDIDEDLVRRIEPEAVRGATIFYASKRHPLEILPEFLTSLWLILTLAAVLLNFDPVSGCRMLECRLLVASIVALSLLFSFVYPFGLEVWRWNRDIYYLTQRGWSHWYFRFDKAKFDNEVSGFVTSTRVDTPVLYDWLGWDVGNLASLSVDESKKFTPLMPRPLVLQTRIREAQSYKPPRPSTEVPLWRE